MTIKYPEIMEVISQGLQDGQLEYIQNTTRTVTSKRGAEERTNFVHILPQSIEDGGVRICDSRKLFLMLKDLQKSTQETKTRKLLVVSREGVDRDYTRKLIEFVFRKEDINVLYLIPPGRNIKNNKSNEVTQTMRAPHRESLLIRAGGKSYADLLREVKSNVDVRKIGVDIKQIKKTQAGDLLLVVDAGKADVLQKEVKDKVQAQMGSIKRNMATIMLPGIDAVTTETEITAAFEMEMGIGGDQIRVVSLKEGKYGNQTAFVEVPRSNLENLLKKERIRIGWVTCKIMEKMNVARCFRCLEFGHRTRECKGEDRKDHCLKCGKEGHRAKECKNEPLCTKCNGKDHRADNMKCPYFRKIIEGMRRKRLSSMAGGDTNNRNGLKKN